MNENQERSIRLSDDDARFDRLVDGELLPDEYRALLASLDDEPGGWRRCALAFLQSQALRADLDRTTELLPVSEGYTGDRPLSPAGGSVVQPAGPVQSRNPLALKTMLAMAASFLVAFALGVAQPWWRPNVVPNGPTIAESQDPNERPTADPAGPTLAGTNARRDTFKPVANVRLVVDGPGGDSTSVGELPMYEVPGSVESWLAGEPPALSAELLQSLEERGHQIKRHVQYVPVQLEDGRQGIVPVENYQITPVDQRAY